MLKPKEDNDKMLKTLRDIISTSPNNRTCFDCGQKGVTYVNCTLGSFVCSTCSGILRGLTPPHRIKSISMAKFTPDELEYIRSHGNDECAKTWLGLWDSKRTLKQDHRDFMVDKYERKRYYLEPASPLKSINSQPSVTPPSQQQQQALVNGSSSATKSSNSSIQQSDNLAVLKSFQLTPPSANNRHHRTNHHQTSQNGNVHENGSNNNNFFTNHLNGTTNGSSQNGVSNEFVADFRKASIYNSNNSLNSTGSGSGQQVNGKITNGISDTTNNNNNGDANFADFENNKIYNAAEEYYKNNNTNYNSLTNMSSPCCNSNSIQWNIWQQFQWPNTIHNHQPEQYRWSLPMSTSSLSNNSLNSSNGTFTSNSSLNSTPSADRYAALKDLDEQLREAKAPVTPVEQQQPNPPVKPINPFNPFQNVPSQQHQAVPQQQHQQQQQSYQNWSFPETQTNFNGFGSPPLGTNGFFYANNMTQPSPFGGNNIFGNPFMTNGAAAAVSTNNPFL